MNFRDLTIIFLAVIMITIGLAYAGTETINIQEGALGIFDEDSTEAIICRKDGDAGDVAICDTVNEVWKVDNIAEITTDNGVSIDGLNIQNDGTTTTFLGPTGDYLRIGDASVTSNSLDSEDDILLTGEVEFDGRAYFDVGPYFTGAPRLYNDVRIRFGDVDDSQLDWSTAQTSPSMVWGLGNASRSLIFTRAVHSNLDFDHANASNPTIFIHSNISPDTDNTQWISFAHDQTDGVIDVGAGDIKLDDDVDVTGTFTVAGQSTFNGNVYYDSNLVNVNDEVKFRFGDSGDTIIKWSRDQDPDALLFMLDDNSQYVVFTNTNYLDHDFDHPAQVNPTLFIQSATNPDTDNTQWMSLTHNTTDGIINVGTGSIQLDAGTVITGSLEATSGGTLTGTWTDLGTVTTIDIDGGTADNLVIGATTSAAGTFSTITTDTLNLTSLNLTTLSVTGDATFVSVDINGGSADNLVIGASGSAAGTFSSITTDTLNITSLSLSGTIETDSGVETDLIAEQNAGSGVAIDGVTLKDNGVLLQVQTKTTDTLAETDTGVILCDTSGGSVTLTLPAASGNAGLTYTIKKISASNTCTIDGNLSETIDGSTDKDLVSNYAFAKIICDGDEWHVIASNTI